MLGNGNWQFDSEGNIVVCYSMVDYFESIDELDDAYGAALAALEGETIKAIYILHDGEEWDYDAPVVLRLGSIDISVNSLSCYKLAIGIERVDTERTARLLGCDYDPDRSFDDLVGDLEWRIHECSEAVAGAKIQQFYWTADSNYCPLALYCRLDNGLHLRIGDRGDVTFPSAGDLREKTIINEFDQYALPMQYPKPASNLPVIEECLKLTGLNVFGARLDRPIEDCVREIFPWHGRAFIGGFEIRADNPTQKFISVGKLPEGTSESFLIGQRIVFLPGKPTSQDGVL